MWRLFSATTPYVLYKDACNRKRNQHNLGTIKCTNFCMEIVDYFVPDEVTVCYFASIAVDAPVRPDKTFDFKKLKLVAKIATSKAECTAE